VSSALSTLLWLDRPEDRRLRQHVLFGDALALREQGTWIWRRPCAEADAAETDPQPQPRFLTLRYRGAGGGNLLICLGRGGSDPDAIAELRRTHNPAAAERKWNALIARAGAFERLAPGRAAGEVETLVRYAQGFAKVRRAAHPSGLIDRLMVRDRELVADRFEQEYGCGLAAGRIGGASRVGL
jgi:hypothetical protein